MQQNSNIYWDSSVGLNERLIREETFNPGYLCVLEAKPWRVPQEIQEVIFINFITLDSPPGDSGGNIY